MKRGNTALKRAVSVASVAAMAIAGAVLAAPAASAATSAVTGPVRSTPATDAAYVGTFAPGNLYSVVGTGQAPNVVIGQSWQNAAGIQIALDSWTASQTVTLKAPANVKFSTAPTATLAKDSIDAATATSTWNSVAGHTGTNAHLFRAPAAPTTLTDTKVTVSGSGTDLITITLPSTPRAAVTDQAFVLSISGLRVNLDADYSPAAHALDVTVDGSAITAPADVTVAYVNSLGISTKGDTTSAGNEVTLPAIVVSEALKAAFPATASVELFEVQVTGTGNDSTGIVLDTTALAAAKIAAPSSIVAPVVAAGALPNSFKVTTGATTPTTAVASIESVGVTGLKVTNVKPGTDLTLTITAPVASTVKGETSKQSGGASVTLKPTSALPRIAGTSRYATAAKVAAAGNWSGDAVIIANGEDAKQGVDALAANFLAGVLNAPILLTQGGTLPADTEASLKKLFDGSSAAVTVYYMGKTDSVSQAVRDKVEAAISGAQSVVGSVKSKDVAGDDRYATSVEAAKAVDVNQIASYNLGNGNLRTAFLASGQVNADALAAGAVSAAADIPVLLTTDGDALPKSVSDAISSLHIEQIIILGGTDRVSQKVEDALKDASVNVIRKAGSDRYATATALAQLGIDNPTDGLGTTISGTIYLANGNGGWADALTAGALVAQTNNSLVTVSDSGSLPTATALFLSKNNGLLTNVEGLGGTDRVADSVITQAQALVK